MILEHVIVQGQLMCLISLCCESRCYRLRSAAAETELRNIFTKMGIKGFLFFFLKTIKLKKSMPKMATFVHISPGKKGFLKVLKNQTLSHLMY